MSMNGPKFSNTTGIMKAFLVERNYSLNFGFVQYNTEITIALLMPRLILFLQGPVGPTGHLGQPGIPGVKVLLFLLFFSFKVVLYSHLRCSVTQLWAV